DAVNLPSGIAVDHDQRRYDGFANGDVHPVLRRCGPAAAGRLEDQLVANSLANPARDRSDVDRCELFLRRGTAKGSRSVERTKTGAAVAAAAKDAECSNAECCNKAAPALEPASAHSPPQPVSQRHSRSFAGRR